MRNYTMLFEELVSPKTIAFPQGVVSVGDLIELEEKRNVQFIVTDVDEVMGTIRLGALQACITTTMPMMSVATIGPGVILLQLADHNFNSLGEETKVEAHFRTWRNYVNITGCTINDINYRIQKFIWVVTSAQNRCFKVISQMVPASAAIIPSAFLDPPANADTHQTEPTFFYEYGEIFGFPAEPAEPQANLYEYDSSATPSPYHFVEPVYASAGPSPSGAMHGAPPLPAPRLSPTSSDSGRSSAMPAQTSSTQMRRVPIERDGAFPSWPGAVGRYCLGELLHLFGFRRVRVVPLTTRPRR